MNKIDFLEDSAGDRFQLRFLRDKEGREVDFALIKYDRIETLVEAKLSDDKVSKSLNYYSEKLKPRSSLQLVGNIKRDDVANKLKVLNAVDFLSGPEFKLLLK